METDTSILLYELYFKAKDRFIEITLKNGRQLSGFICGFFKGDPDFGESYIIKWHFITERDKNTFGTTILGYISGEIIHHRDILFIYFRQDQTILFFYNQSFIK